MPSGGLLALLDDVAAFTSRVSAASVDDISNMASMAGTSMKGAAPVVLDDIPVTVQVMQEEEVRAHRELHVLGRVFKNAVKARLAITPLTSLVSYFAPAAMPLVLGAGGAYLAYEGAEKVLHGVQGMISPHHDEGDEAEAAVPQTHEQVEDDLVKGAGKTDVIMGTEISFMGMDAIEKIFPEFGATGKFGALLASNLGVASATYGLVAGLVSFDNIGLHLKKTAEGDGFMARAKRSVGQGLIDFSPKAAKTLSTVGTGAMLWIGGELITPGVAAVSKMAEWHGLHHAAEGLIHNIHHLEHAAQAALPQSMSFLSGVVGWGAEALPFAGVGLAAGAGIIGASKLVSAAQGAIKKLWSPEKTAGEMTRADALARETEEPAFALEATAKPSAGVSAQPVHDSPDTSQTSFAVAADGTVVPYTLPYVPQTGVPEQQLRL